MLKSNGPNSISKDALRDEGCPWLINCTTQEYLVNVGLNSHFNTSPISQGVSLTFLSRFAAVKLTGKDLLWFLERFKAQVEEISSIKASKPNCYISHSNYNNRIKLNYSSLGQVH